MKFMEPPTDSRLGRKEGGGGGGWQGEEGEGGGESREAGHEVHGAPYKFETGKNWGGGGGRRGREGGEKEHPTLMDLGFTSLHTKHYVSNVQLHVVICYVLTYIMPCFY
jgi:hypothetical protein